jgi:hypothetical protein
MKTPGHRGSGAPRPGPCIRVTDRRSSRKTLFERCEADMCGIVGLAYRDRVARWSRTIRMCAAINTAAPTMRAIRRGAVGLGIRSSHRLERRPTARLQRGWVKVIVFNGEIYNYRELRERLIARGRAPHSLRHRDRTAFVRDMGADCARELAGCSRSPFGTRAAARCSGP